MAQIRSGKRAESWGYCARFDSLRNGSGRQQELSSLLPLTLDPKRIISENTIKVTINGQLTPINITKEEKIKTNNRASPCTQTEIPTTIPGWSNGEPNLSGCGVTSQDASWGIYWKLGEVFEGGSSFVPLDNVYLHDDTSKIHNAVMTLTFMSTGKSGIKFSGVLAYQVGASEIQAQLVDDVMELRNEHTWIDLQRDFWDGDEIEGTTFMGIGIRGKYVLARYWKFMGKGCPTDINTSEYAYFIAFIPEIKNGQMIGEYRVEYNTPTAWSPVENRGNYPEPCTMFKGTTKGRPRPLPVA
jgi:hypothetical protein